MASPVPSSPSGLPVDLAQQGRIIQDRWHGDRNPYRKHVADLDHRHKLGVRHALDLFR